MIAALTRGHFHSLATTGGTQPYTALQEEFREEQLQCPGLDTGFLDRSAFTAAGYMFAWESAELKPYQLSGIILIGD